MALTEAHMCKTDEEAVLAKVIGYFLEGDLQAFDRLEVEPQVRVLLRELVMKYQTDPRISSIELRQSVGLSGQVFSKILHEVFDMNSNTLRMCMKVQIAVAMVKNHK